MGRPRPGDRGEVHPEPVFHCRGISVNEAEL